MGMTWIRPVLMSVDLLSLHMIVMWFLDSIKRRTAGCIFWVSLGHRSDLNIEEVGQWTKFFQYIVTFYSNCWGSLCLIVWLHLHVFWVNVYWLLIWLLKVQLCNHKQVKKRNVFPAGNYVNVTVALVWHRNRYRISYYGFKSDLIAKLKSQSISYLIELKIKGLVHF